MSLYRIFPGSMGAAQIAIDLFGVDSILPAQSWLSPVYIDVSDENAVAAKSLLADHGLKIEKEKQP